MRRLLLATMALGAATALSAAGGENMLGRQSQNEGIDVLPAPKAVVIDGDLAEWDWSGRIWVFADAAVRDRYSVEAAAMWDKEYLYLAAKWKDPTPASSLVNPAHNPGDGWKADAWQLRIRTTDRTLWVTTWPFSPPGAPITPALSICTWKDMNDGRSDMDTQLLQAAPGGTDLGEGVAMAYKRAADGNGYVQELRLPWRLLHRAAPPIAPGYVLRIGMEFLWGAPDGGRSAPIHRYADNMQKGVTTREFYWTAWSAWGDARLVPQGGVPLRRYVADGGRIEGTIPVSLAVPRSATRFALVLEDRQGRRVRNLAGDCDPREYETAAPATDELRTVTVLWDGLDDAGKRVAPDSYTVRGLAHDGLSAVYERSFYNPGTPPWATTDGRGGWMADHTAAVGVAACGDRMILSAPFAEGGTGIIAVGRDGRKQWSQYRGAARMAVTEEFIYAYQSFSWSAGAKDAFLCRYAAVDGTEKPFTADGKALPFEWSIKGILGLKELPAVNGLAAFRDRLVLSLDGNRLAVLDAATTKLLKLVPVPGVGAIAFDPAGALHGVIGVAPDAAAAKPAAQPSQAELVAQHLPGAPGRSVARIDLDNGTLRTWATPGLGQAAAIAFDRDGHLLVADTGPDSQVKAFAANGRQQYTCGRKGGRPRRGAFDAQAMIEMSGVAADAGGSIWVAESSDYPRRVSVWRRDGTLVRDYLGNTGYSGVACYLHDQDPALAYCGTVEMRLARPGQAWNVTRILWVPDAAKGERFAIDPLANTPTCRFTSAAAGATHEYMYSHGEGGPHVVYLERAGDWKPVAAVCLVGQMLELMDRYLIPSAMPAGEFAGLDPADGCFWNDANADGIPQRAECTIVPVPQKSTVGKRISAPPLALANGWGGRPGTDLVFYTIDANSKVVRFRPLRFTADGAPVYGPEGMAPLDVTANAAADTFPITAEERLVVLGANHGGPDKSFLGVDLKTGRVAWTYPNHYAGVHGSHLAPMPKPGLLIGPLKICGSADLGPGIGGVFLIRGNLGQDFIFTTDGLCVGALFPDVRLPGEALPDREEDLIGKRMDSYSEGSEPFNGWFGRQADGRVRQVSGFKNQVAIVTEIRGLQTIRRCVGTAVTVDAATLAAAEAANAARAAQAAGATRGSIAKFAAPPAGAAGDAAWSRVPALAVRREGQPEEASVRLAHDGQWLYLRADVKDPSPWKNRGQDLGRLFKTGDAVDLQLRTDSAAKGDQPQAGDLRVVIANLGGQPVAVLMQPVAPGAPPALKRAYASPVVNRDFDRVEILAAARVVVTLGADGYRVDAAIPLTALGLVLKPGLTLRGDVGIIASDSAGTSNAARVYWSNKSTNLVSDLPSEAWLYPAAWGELLVE